MDQVHTIDRERGSSLIEIMIATMVAMVLIGALFSVVFQQGQQRRGTAEKSLALAAALSNLERARTLDQAGILALDGVGFDVPGVNGAPGGLQPVPGDPDGLPGSFAVLIEQQSGPATLYRVVTTIRWRGGLGRRVLRLQALVGERR